MLGICISIFLSQKLSRGRLSWEDTILIGACIIGLGILFAKLFYLFITYSLSDIILMVREHNFDFLSSGFVYYGGLIGGIFGYFIAEKLVGFSIISHLDSIVPAIPIGHSIGRIGCFLSGCCFGIEYSGFGSISYPLLNGQIVHLFPVQLIEAGFLLVLGLFLITIRKEKRGLDLFLIYLFSYSILRFILEYYRGDIIRGYLLSFSTSQWISLIILFTIFGIKLFKPNTIKEN